MGCGCNKNKKPETSSEPQAKEQSNSPMAFRNVAQESQKSGITNKISMVKSFATALASRGITDKKVSLPVKQLRVISCFGNSNVGGVLPPCEHLKESKTPGKHYCGGCGCGDKPHTWLMAENKDYGKLDYPKLNCPLNMPGFTNYQPSAPDEANEPITRRYYIENMNFNEVLHTKVSLPDPVDSNKSNATPAQQLPPDSEAQR
jgi:hypothetical protein